VPAPREKSGAATEVGMSEIPGVDIVGIRGCATAQECKEWCSTDEREKEFMTALSRFLSDEGDKAVLGKIGGAWDGRWIFWHR